MLDCGFYNMNCIDGLKEIDTDSIDLTYDLYGVTERDTRYFFKSEWDSAREKGYFMA